MKNFFNWLYKIFYNKKTAIFFFSLAILSSTFFYGYNLGQKGKLSGVVNTEVGQPSGIDFSVFWEAWNKLKTESIYKPDTETMIGGAISGLLSSVNDPYTVYFTAEDNQRFREDIEGSFDGIGVELIQKNGVPTVVAPLSDSPAAKAGIKAGDIISKVDGTDTSTLGFNETVNKIRGEKGTEVTLTIIRSGADEALTFEVERDTITVKSVTWEEKEQSGKKFMYVKIRQFGDDTETLFAQAAADIIKDNPNGIIIDLRDNPGGYFESAVDLSSYFVDSGTVVIQQDKDGNKQQYSTTHSATLKNFKTTVLVNGGSASASEIFSGALQDHKAGTLIGEKTFGKGSVQELINLTDGSAVKITIAKWLTPNGRSINGEGITPDVEVTAGSNSIADNQLNRALEYLVSGK